MSGASDECAVRALDMLTASLNIRKSLLSYDDDESRQEIATTENNIGRVHYMLGSHLTSLEAYVGSTAF